MSPATCTAVNSSCTMNPSAAPIATSVIAVVTRKPADSCAGSVGASRPKTVTASASANAPLTGEGMALELNGGASSTKPAPRAVASRRAARVAASTCRCTPASGAAEQVRQHREQLVGEGDQLVEHPVPGHQQGDGHRDHLRHEGERLLL